MGLKCEKRLLDRAERPRARCLRHTQYRAHARHFARRLYFFNTSRSLSWGRAITVRLFAPVMVSAATMALITASSVAWTVARKRGSIWSLGSMVSWWSPLGPAAPVFAVEEA